MIQIDPQRATMEDEREGRKEKESSKFYFREMTNESKVFYNDVTSSLKKLRSHYFLCIKEFSLQQNYTNELRTQHLIYMLLYLVRRGKRLTCWDKFLLTSSSLV